MSTRQETHPFEVNKANISFLEYITLSSKRNGRKNEGSLCGGAMILIREVVLLILERTDGWKLEVTACLN